VYADVDRVTLAEGTLLREKKKQTVAKSLCIEADKPLWNYSSSLVLKM
jgi:hypothetical protein